MLDCLKEPIGEVGKVRVYYNLLEADRYGNVPSDGKKFDSESRTGFQIIAQRGDKASYRRSNSLSFGKRFKKKIPSRKVFVFALNVNTSTL